MVTLTNYSLYYEDLKIHKKQVLGQKVFLVSNWTAKRFSKHVIRIKHPVRRLGSRRVR